MSPVALDADPVREAKSVSLPWTSNIASLLGTQGLLARDAERESVPGLDGRPMLMAEGLAVGHGFDRAMVSGVDDSP